MALCTGGFGETRVGLRSTKLLVVREKKTSGTQRTRAHVGLRGGDVWHFRLSFCSLVYMYNQTLTFSLIFERFSLIWFNKGWLWVLLRDLLIKKWIRSKSNRTEFGCVRFCSIGLIMRGKLADTQYHNTVRKIGKFRNTVSTIDRIPISHFWSVTLKVVSISRACLSQAFMHQQSTSANARTREETSN